MAKQLSGKQRQAFAEKFMDLGNLMFAALVLAQVFGERRDAIIALGGIVAFVSMYMVAIQLMKRR